MRYVIGLDLGTTAIKISLFSEKGICIGDVTKEYVLITPVPGVVEQEVGVYWSVFSEGMHTLLEQTKVDPQDIISLGLSAQGETLIMIDEAGRPLRNAIVWMDNRAQEESDILAARFTNEVIHRVTGQVSMMSIWPAAKIFWVKRHQPEVYKRVYKYLLIEDYFLYRLTGKFAAEGSLLCSTILWDINTKKYWPEMLSYLGICEEQLPQIEEPGTAVGRLLPEVASELGLSPEMVCALGALDQACGAIGVGNTSAGIFSESTGSALAVVAVTDRPVFDPAREMPCFYFGIKDTYMIHSFTTGGMLIKWYRDNLCQIECAAESLSGYPAYNMIDDEAREIAPGAGGLVVLPHLQGSGPPDSDQSARGTIYGLTLSHTQKHIARACLESVAITLCRMVEAVEALGVDIKEIRSLGGGAKSPLWCQIKADATGKTIKTMKNTENAACLGAGVLAGVAAGIWPSVAEAMKTIAREDRSFLPDVSNRQAYDTLLKKYKELTNALKPVFES